MLSDPDHREALYCDREYLRVICGLRVLQKESHTYFSTLGYISSWVSSWKWVTRKTKALVEMRASLAAKLRLMPSVGLVPSQTVGEQVLQVIRSLFNSHLDQARQ